MKQYITQYMKKRYNTDSVFRAKVKLISAKCTKRRNEKRRIAGLCIVCGNENTNKDFKTCTKCLKFKKEKYYKKIKEGYCGSCGNIRQNKKRLLCDYCATLRRRKLRKKSGTLKKRQRRID